ncbi:WXG100 family type VII secretion target [Microbacterium luticocti]|uniref:WXG100 family type VII secretion target n=1 Tax=Microbacterium luticocti TaxID=451764 RepID=UPI000403A41E|nr:WXG100 family type VII secretion target [Microbacterium luticocti]
MTISAEEGALLKGAKAVGDAKQGIDRHVKTVRGEIEQVSGYWTGAAAAAYTQLMGRWDEETRKLNNVLITLEDALKGTHQDQSNTEEEHGRTISGLTSMMQQ